MIQDKITNKKGFALMLTLIVLSIVIAVTLSLVELSMKKLELAVDTRDSERVFHAATAAMECGMYSRNRNPGGYIDWSSGGAGTAPRLTCFGQNRQPTAPQSREGTAATGFYTRFNYNLPNTDIGGEPTFLYVEVHILNAQSITGTSMSRSGISSLGTVTCLRGSICTVVIARAYNRATAPSAGGVEIMRELSAIF